MFYLLDKPKGLSSFKAIRTFAFENNIKKIGHTGTLDPLATGLLLVATEEDTKLIDYVDKGVKTYRASMKLGFVSDTYDSEGEVEETKKDIPSKEEIEKELMSFVGKQKQMPPAFSAKKINGKKAYELAREGKEVVLKEVEIEITKIEDIVFGDSISFTVEVSRGTYIRSLIHDLGSNLGCGAIMDDLRRTKIADIDESMIGKEINILSLLTMPLIKTDSMKDLLDGKLVKTESENGVFILEYKDDAFGTVEVTDGFMKAKKLIGNKFTKVGL